MDDNFACRPRAAERLRPRERTGRIDNQDGRTEGQTAGGIGAFGGGDEGSIRVRWATSSSTVQTVRSPQHDQSGLNLAPFSVLVSRISCFSGCRQGRVHAMRREWGVGPAS